MGVLYGSMKMITQVSLVRNFEWFDIQKLEGFTNEVKEILLSNKLLSRERIDKIIEQIKKRIEFVNQLKQAKETNNDNM